MESKIVTLLKSGGWKIAGRLSVRSESFLEDNFLSSELFFGLTFPNWMMCLCVSFDEVRWDWGCVDDSVEECNARIDKSFLFDKWYWRWFFSFVISFFILSSSILEPITRDLETCWCWNWWMLESVFVVLFHCLLRPLESSNRIILSFMSGWRRLNVREERFCWFCRASFSRLSKKTFHIFRHVIKIIL